MDMRQQYALAMRRRRFYRRFMHAVIQGLIAIALALGVGMVGYHYFERLSWLDSFASASMILSGMGQLGTLQTTGGKLFAGMYALFSGLFFVLIVALIFSPWIHRFLFDVHADFHEHVTNKDHS